MHKVKSRSAGFVAVFGLALLSQVAQADICRQYDSKITQIESTGVQGDDLIDRLYEIENASVCPRWKIQMGRALWQLDEWDEAIIEFQDARSPEYPETYAHLANAFWQSAGTKTDEKKRDADVSDAYSNGDIAFKLYRARSQTPPEWAISLMQDLDRYTATAGAEYYAMVLSQSEKDTKGTGVVPGLNVQINFETESYTLDAQATQKVSEIAWALDAYLSKKPDARFEVIGHTDIRGGFQFNQTLSEQRARSVVSELRSAVRGIVVSGHGKGKTELKYPGDNEKINRFNRRVEIKMK